MRRSPEVLIARLRNRKGRLITYSLLIPICLGMLGLYGFVLVEAYAGLIPKEGADMVMHDVMSHQILVAISILHTMGFLVALALGAAIAGLLMEFTPYTKNELLVYLWDRVQALEQAQNANTHPVD